MKTVAIQDANILIDLLTTGLFAHCLALDYDFTTTNLVLAELFDHQIEMISPHISSGIFTVIEIDENLMEDILIASREDSRLSEQDWYVLFYAQRNEALLLTGDKRLRVLSESKGIKVCGVLWILDQLFSKGHLSKSQACRFLKELLSKNKRLPVKECEQRIKGWCES